MPFIRIPGRPGRFCVGSAAAGLRRLSGLEWRGGSGLPEAKSRDGRAVLTPPAGGAGERTP